MSTSQFATWVSDFEAAARRRRADGDPDWARGAKLDAALVRSLQRFQLGESGDGANLAAKASLGGDEGYATAVRLFIAEEQNHARLLAALLAAANARVITSHWSDAVFVRLRRALGLRLELMVLFVAEFIALSYYRALRDGTGDPLAAEVAGRILADEERHVRFHSQQLRLEFAALPRGRGGRCPGRGSCSWRARRALSYSTTAPRWSGSGCPAVASPRACWAASRRRSPASATEKPPRRQNGLGSPASAPAKPARPRNERPSRPASG